MSTLETPIAAAVQARITMQPVESSQLDSYGYDAESATLAIRFRGHGGKRGGLYHYANVGPTDWQAFSDSTSKGRHFTQQIKALPGRYPCTRVHEPAE